LPNLIFFGFNTFNTEALRFIDSVKTDITTTDIPIILMSKTDVNRIKDNTYFYDIKYFIKKPFAKADFLAFTKRVLEEENSFIGSYTNRYIKAFISYKSSQNIASRMMSILETISYKIHIQPQIKLDMKSVLGILSTSIRDGSINKAIKFYEDMKFAVAILKLLKGVKNPKSIYEQLIYAIYEMESMIYHNLDINSISLEKVIEPEILKVIKEVYNENEIFVKSGADFELVWDRLTDIVMNDSSLEFNLVNKFIEYSKNILREIILKGSDSIVKVINSDKKLEFIIIPNQPLKISKKILDSKIEDIRIDKEIKKIDNKDNLIISINKTLNKIKKDNQLNIEVENKISAKEYLKELKLDISAEVADMQDLEEEFDLNLLFLNKKNLFENFGVISSIIAKYALNVVNMTFEFDEVENNLTGLSQLFTRVDWGRIPKDDLSSVISLLEELKKKLKVWREEIFMEQSAKDIHYLDEDIINICKKIEGISEGS